MKTLQKRCLRRKNWKYKEYYSQINLHHWCRAAGAGPVGQAMAGPLLTIIVKYCEECAHGRGFASARGAAAPNTCPSKSRYRSRHQ